MDQSHDHLAAIGVTDSEHSRRVGPIGGLEIGDDRSGEFDVVDILESGRKEALASGVVPIPFESVEVDDNGGPAVCHPVERRTSEPAIGVPVLLRAVKDQNQVAGGD